MKKLLFLIFLSILTLNSGIYRHAKYGWSLDLPEGYGYEESKYPGKVTFIDQSGFIHFQVYALPAGKSEMFVKEKIIKTMSLEGKLIDFKGQGKNGSSVKYGVFNSVFQGGTDKWYVALFPGSGEQSYVVLGSVPEQYYRQAKPEMDSLIDSFYPDNNSDCRAGLLTRLAWHKSRRTKHQVEFNGVPFTIDFSQADRKALNRLIDREKKILIQYKTANHKVMVRFYRQIYNLSCERFITFCKSLEGYFRKNNFDNRQRFSFLRQGVTKWRTETLNGTEIIKSPLDSLVEQAGDCDSKSLTLHLLLNYFKIPSEILVSYYYQHAALGVPEDFLGQKGRGLVKGTRYHGLVFFELLQKNGPVKDMSDSSKWYSLSLAP